jgi:hypothetical protein
VGDVVILKIRSALVDEPDDVRLDLEDGLIIVYRNRPVVASKNPDRHSTPRDRRYSKAWKSFLQTSTG